VNTLSVCPVEDIAAPLDKVWSLLVDPDKLDLWWDAKLQRVRSVGTMVPSQLIDAAPQGFFNKFHIGLAVKDVNHAQHRLSLHLYPWASLTTSRFHACRSVKAAVALASVEILSSLQA
jgi:hypothetical protein